jgi:hypothetical protein
MVDVPSVRQHGGGMQPMHQMQVEEEEEEEDRR